MPWNEVMPKWKAGELKSSSGQPVTSQKQAVAIMLSEKRAAAHKPEYRASSIKDGLKAAAKRRKR